MRLAVNNPGRNDLVLLANDDEIVRQPLLVGPAGGGLGEDGWVYGRRYVLQPTKI